MRRLLNVTKSIVSSLTIAIPVTVAFTDSVAYIAKVDGVSMRPAFNPEPDTHLFDIIDDHDQERSRNLKQSNDFVLLSHWRVRKYKIMRGEIVALISPRDPQQKIIKRVIGLEGDTVVTRPNCKKRCVKIPRGHCWLEGDYNAKSMDSNFFGPVAIGLITSLAICIVWPPERWQMMVNQMPRDRKIIEYDNGECFVTIDSQGTLLDIEGNEDWISGDEEQFGTQSF